ncbi:MAG: cytochrome c, partial [Chroococcidiopsis sp.]
TPDKRTPVFYRGYDVYDPEKVGFVAEGKEAEKVGFKYDTRVTANSNQGHLYGTDLPAEEKKALIEYLKTL